MKHFYCDGGCGGVATEEQMEGVDKVCQMSDCAKSRQPLNECDCDNMESHKNQ